MNTTYNFLMNDGRFSGKLPFIYRIFNGEPSEDTKRMISDDGHHIVKVTEEEYNYVKSLPEEVEVHYNGFAIEIEKRFFY